MFSKVRRTKNFDLLYRIFVHLPFFSSLPWTRLELRDWKKIKQIIWMKFKFKIGQL